MYLVYNAILRACSNNGIVPFGEFSGINVLQDSTAVGSVAVKYFRVTLHCINNAIVDLATLSMVETNGAHVCVYRGLGNLILPKAFTHGDSQGARGGTEYGFMSTTLHKHIAVGYCAESAGVKTVLQAPMSTLFRGAMVNWLSQYPEEKEILWPPLVSMQIVEERSSKYSGILYIGMQFVTNPRRTKPVENEQDVSGLVSPPTRHEYNDLVRIVRSLSESSNEDSHCLPK